MRSIDEQARACLEAYLRGINQAGHPPLSPEEITRVYLAIRSRIEEEA